MSGTIPALRITDLSKTFAGVRVLSSVDLTVEMGEVHALLGQNGSGKSTLIKCLAGVHRPDPGSTIEVAGKILPPTIAPSEAQRYGLAFVHQDLGLLSNMTVAENLALQTGFQQRGGLISWRAQQIAARAVLEEFGLELSPTARVADLPVTARTLLAIARAFQPSRGGESQALRCLVLDEPTAALPDNDAELLFTAIERVRTTGVGVVYVTHRLDEVLRIADRATVLRDGAKTAELPARGSSRRQLVEAIVGRVEPEQAPAASPKVPADVEALSPAIEVAGLTGVRIKDVNLSVQMGEIVGIAGLAGSGRSELARLLFGAQVRTAGVIKVGGTARAIATPRAAMDAGVALVPEDRRRDGCVLTMSTAENVTLPKLPTIGPGFLSLRRERRAVANAIKDLDIRPADPKRQIGTLSGGNQQKVVLAKWLRREPGVLILDEPVQGVDVGAKAEIFAKLLTIARDGTGVLVIDSDFENLAAICDRVLVLRGGAIVEELVGDRITAARMSAATFGVDDQDIQRTSEPVMEVAR